MHLLDIGRAWQWPPGKGVKPLHEQLERQYRQAKGIVVGATIDFGEILALKLW